VAVEKVEQHRLYELVGRVGREERGLEDHELAVAWSGFGGLERACVQDGGQLVADKTRPGGG
jgi:hypothetical protein